MNVIELKNISKTYTLGEKVTPIEKTDFCLKKGEFAAVSGESGIGKSTLLMIIGGLLKPSDGKVQIDGQDYWKLKDKEQSEIRKKKIGYLFQSIQVIQALTVEENIRFAASISKQKIKKNDVLLVLERFGLKEKKDSLPCRLSGGQKRRLMIAITYVRDPEIILADEPTNDLDEKWIEIIMQTFEEWLAKKKTLVLVTHNKELWEKAENKYIIQDKVLVKANVL